MCLHSIWIRISLHLHWNDWTTLRRNDGMELICIIIGQQHDIIVEIWCFYAMFAMAFRKSFHIAYPEWKQKGFVDKFGSMHFLYHNSERWCRPMKLKCFICMAVNVYHNGQNYRFHNAWQPANIAFWWVCWCSIISIYSLFSLIDWLLSNLHWQIK